MAQTAGASRPVGESSVKAVVVELRHAFFCLLGRHLRHMLLELDPPCHVILDCVHDLQASVAQFLSPDFELLFNRVPQPLSAEEVLGCVARLHRLGLVSIEAAHEVIDADRLAEVCKPAECRVGLTAAGGAAWEAHFRPDWARMVIDEQSFLDDGSVLFEFFSLSRAPLEEILRRVPAYAKRLVLEEVRPLEMYYWKHFPVGWRLSFVLPEGDGWGPGSV